MTQPGDDSAGSMLPGYGAPQSYGLRSGQVAATEHMQGLLVFMLGITGTIGVVVGIIGTPFGIIAMFMKSLSQAPTIGLEVPVLAFSSFLLFIIGPCSLFGWRIGAKAKKEIEAGAPYLWQGKLVTGYKMSKVSSATISVILGVFLIGSILAILN